MFKFITAACAEFLAGWISRARMESRIRTSRAKPRLLEPLPAPGMRRKYIYSPSTMAECGGPCFEAWDPRACTCGALWRDVAARWPTIYVEDYPPGYWDDGIPPNLPSRSGVRPMAPEADPRFGVPWDESRIQRGHGHGGPTAPKPDIIPKPQFPPPRMIPGDTP